MKGTFKSGKPKKKYVAGQIKKWHKKCWDLQSQIILLLDKRNAIMVVYGIHKKLQTNKRT